MIKVSFDKNPYWLTKVQGDNADEITAYCKENKLEIVESIETGRRLSIIVWALKPNARMRLLRKRIVDLDDWKILKVEKTPKMFWITYERDTHDTETE